LDQVAALRRAWAELERGVGQEIAAEIELLPAPEPTDLEGLNE
jgi:hypothetical protein